MDEGIKMAWKSVIEVIVLDPCLARRDFYLRFYIQADFCAKGMGFVGMQLANNEVSIAAMYREMAGGKYKFWRDQPREDSERTMPLLRPVYFGSRRCKGYKKGPAFLPRQRVCRQLGVRKMPSLPVGLSKHVGHGVVHPDVYHHL